MTTKICAILCSASLLALASPAFAQVGTATGAATGAPTASEAEGAEIIVEARRRDESVQDVPLVVNTVSTQEIQKLNILNFTDVQTLVPGLQLASQANGIAAGAQLRGIQYDPTVSFNPTVAFYQNDATVQATYVLQTLYDVGQIEVQRGPQGTLRGEASPSGSITVTTKKPDLYKIGANFNMSGSTIGEVNLNGGIGIPIIKGIAAIRIAGSVDENEFNRVHTIQTNGRSINPEAHSDSGRISALITPTDWLRLEGTYQRTTTGNLSYGQYESFSLANPAATPSPVLISPADRESILSNPNTFTQLFKIYNWRAEVRQFGQRLIYQGGRTTLSLHSVQNSDLANFIAPRNFFQTTDTVNAATTHEVRLQNDSRLLDHFDYVVGYFHAGTGGPGSVTNLTTETPVLLPAAFGGGLATVATTPIRVLGERLTENSIFGNLTYHLGSSTEISVGGRHLSQKQPAGGLVIAGNTIVTPGVDDKGWIYSATLKHNFSQDLMVYASTGTSRRVGPNVIGDFSVAPSALEKSFLYLPPETSRNYEIGLKSTLFDNRLRLDLSAFHQTFKNFPYRNQASVYYVNYSATVSGGVVSVTPGVAAGNFAAAVPVTVNGAEIQADFNITHHWTAGILASYALGRIKNGNVPCNDLNRDGVPDNLTAPPTLAQLQAAVGANNISSCRVSQRSSFQSPFSSTIQSEYHLPLSTHKDLFLRGLYSFQGHSIGDPTFAYDSVKAYGLLNLFLGLRDPKGFWELSLYGKNIASVAKATSVLLPATTSYQRLNAAFQAQGATATSTYSQISTTPPREFGVNLRFAFGTR